MSSFQDNNTKSDCGCGLDWSRIEAFQGAKVRSSQSLGSNEVTLQAFHDYCIIDLQLQERTAQNHLRNMRRVLQHTRKLPQYISRSDLRSYLKTYLAKHPTTYANQIKTLRRFFQDFLNQDHLVESFKLPSIGYTPKIVPSKTELQQFYTALETWRDKALFLIYATTGLRKSEVVSLTLDEINRSQRMIYPNNHRHSATKRSWISFYNHEAEYALDRYLSEEQLNSNSLFTLSRNWTYKTWLTTSKNLGITITPQRLREWFCIEMAELGVQDRFIDAFCGRTPKSILARHYTDYSPQRLKKIYEKAGLSVLS